MYCKKGSVFKHSSDPDWPSVCYGTDEGWTPNNLGSESLLVVATV